MCRARLDKTVLRDSVTHELYLGLDRLLPLSASQWDQGFRKLNYHSFDERSKEGAYFIEGGHDGVIQREKIWERVFEKLKLTGQMAHGKINPIFAAAKAAQEAYEECLKKAGPTACFR